MKKILVCVAHPEDALFATGGTIAKYVNEGWRVELICATGTDEGELKKSADMLGVSTLLLLDYKSGTLSGVASGELEEKLYIALRESIADCVITFDTSGINNDPDHIRMCYSTTFAFQKYAKWVLEQLTRAPDVSEEMEPRLYYGCLPESFVEHLQEQKVLPAESFGKPWRGVKDKRITTVIDVSDYGDVKRKALSQQQLLDADIARLLSRARQLLLRQEQYILRMQGTKEVYMGKSDRIASEL